MNIRDLPREPRVGDKIRYSDGLAKVEHNVAGVDYEYGEATRVWLTRIETCEKGILVGMQSSWISRRTLKRWLRLRFVSYLLNYGEGGNE